MKTINELFTDITDKFISIGVIKTLYGLEAGKTFADQFSPVSLESIIFYRVAVLYWSLLNLFELHKAEVSEIIATQKPMTEGWYVTIAKQFQYGHALPPDTHIYDNTGYTDEQITASRIVAYAACVRQGDKLLIKAAKRQGDNLVALTADELAAFSAYMNRVKPAGDVLGFVSKPADALILELDVYYNPLVLNSNGARLDGTAEHPVRDAVKAYLRTLDFNGEVILTHLVDALQGVDGVVIPHIVAAGYSDDTGTGTIEEIYQTYSGYIQMADENFSVRKYIPKN